jgi:KDO2-lipid IV(A) lauroyltransferase
MWKYFAFKIMGTPLSYLPRAVGYLIAHVIADVVYSFSPTLRSVVRNNLWHVMGSEVDDVTLKQATKDVLRNVGRNYFDLVKLPHMKLGDIERCVTVHGWNNFEDALKMGKGVIVVSAHFGSFDIALQILATQSTKVTVPAEPLEPEALLNHFISLRKNKGLNIMPVYPGMKNEIIQSLHRGEIIVIACDRDITRDGYQIDFFGEETTVPPGAVRIAMRTGAAVVPAFGPRRGNSHYDIYIEPALEIITEGDEALAKNMEQLVRVMEKYIKLHPEQWVVLSPIWAMS